jgi:centrosomal protein CEP164
VLLLLLHKPVTVGNMHDCFVGKTNNVHQHTAGSGTCGSGHYQESTEIIQSLENLNTEIREIWEVLNKQQKSSTNRQGEWHVALGPMA